MRGCFVMLLAILATGCASLDEARPAPAGTIIALRSGKVLDAHALVGRLARYDQVLIGEQHDDPAHHRIERWLLSAVDRHSTPPTLLLEMLEPAQQPRVQALQQQAAKGLPEDLPTALDWRPGWDWTLYGGLVRDALLRPAPLRSANLDRAQIHELYRTVPTLPAGQATQPQVRQVLSEAIDQAHCQMLPKDQLPAMVAIQQHRDRRMAEVLREAAPAWLMAGAFHVRKDLGVPLHLADLGADGGVAVLMLAERGSVVTARQADYVWFTPPQAGPAGDPCAALESQAKKDPAEPGQKP